MKRLIEQSPGPGSEQKLAELLRRLEPTESDPFRKRRVWLSLMSARARYGRRGPWTLRALWIAVLLGGGTAAAALGGGALADGGLGSPGFLEDWFGARSPAESVERDLQGHQAPRGTRSPPEADELHPANEDEAGSAATGGADPADTPEVSLEPSREPTADPSRGATPEKLRPRPPAAPTTQKASVEDPTPVVAAIRAWRSDGDAARAQRLLDGYLRDNPRGALAEDALALSIEVAAARKDPRAVTQAKRYLAAYPKGRFRSLAEKVVNGAR